MSSRDIGYTPRADTGITTAAQANLTIAEKVRAYQKGKCQSCWQKGLVCEACGAVIEGYISVSGKNVTPQMHIQATQKDFGKLLCRTCARQAKRSSS